MDSKAILAIALVGGLAIGYLAGREHLKYQLSSAFEAAAAELLAGSAPLVSPQTPAPEPHVKASEQPLSVTLVAKRFSPRDLDRMKIEEEILIETRFDNKTGKNIRAFDGTMTFTDLLGNVVYRVRLEINEPVAAGKSLTWEGALPYNEFDRDLQRLRGEPRENLKTSFIAGKVLFEDGVMKDYD